MMFKIYTCALFESNLLVSNQGSTYLLYVTLEHLYPKGTIVSISHTMERMIAQRLNIYTSAATHKRPIIPETVVHKGCLVIEQ